MKMEIRFSLQPAYAMRTDHQNAAVPITGVTTRIMTMIDYDKEYGKVIATFYNSFVANFLYNQVVKVHYGVPVMKENYESIYEYDTCRWVFYYSIDDTGIHIVQCDARRFDDGRSVFQH